ncbi:hypothetical protein [Cellulomonas sp. PS-H5]|nr:hypothetical protein [Cellulomonas sp. PS-H5]
MLLAVVVLVIAIELLARIWVALLAIAVTGAAVAMGGWWWRRRQW